MTLTIPHNHLREATALPHDLDAEALAAVRSEAKTYLQAFVARMEAYHRVMRSPEANACMAKLIDQANELRDAIVNETWDTENRLESNHD